MHLIAVKFQRRVNNAIPQLILLTRKWVNEKYKRHDALPLVTFNIGDYTAQQQSQLPHIWIVSELKHTKMKVTYVLIASFVLLASVSESDGNIFKKIVSAVKEKVNVGVDALTGLTKEALAALKKLASDAKNKADKLTTEALAAAKKAEKLAADAAKAAAGAAKEEAERQAAAAKKAAEKLAADAAKAKKEADELAKKLTGK